MFLVCASLIAAAGCEERLILSLKRRCAPEADQDAGLEMTLRTVYVPVYSSIYRTSIPSSTWWILLSP
jgi:hypothetical protein